MTTNEDDADFRECSLSNVWWEFASPEQRVLYRQTESESRRHSHRLDMRIHAAQRIASGEFEAWGHWVCGNAPPVFQQIERALFSALPLFDGQDSIELGDGRFECVVVRKVAAILPERSADMVDVEALQDPLGPTTDTGSSGKQTERKKLKRGAKPKYRFTKAVLDQWHLEDADALKKSASALYSEYQTRFRGFHKPAEAAPVSQRKLHDFLKSWREENGIEVD